MTATTTIDIRPGIFTSGVYTGLAVIESAHHARAEDQGELVGLPVGELCGQVGIASAPLFPAHYARFARLGALQNGPRVTGRLAAPPIHFAVLTYVGVPCSSAEFCIICDTVTLAVTPCHLASVCLIDL